MKEEDITWKHGSKQKLKSYQSSPNVTRTFCATCGAHVSLKYSFQEGVIWLSTSLLDDLPSHEESPDDVKDEQHRDVEDDDAPWFDNCRVLHIFCTSKCEWFELPEDGHPKLSESELDKLLCDSESQEPLQGKELPRKKPSRRNVTW